MDKEDGYRVAYLGPEGTFSQDAAHLAFSNNASFIPFGTILLTAESVLRGTSNYAIVPSENSIDGAINTVTDFFISHPSVRIAGEVSLLVRQNLIAARRIPLRTIKTVVSHPQALAQSRKWLKENLGEYDEIEAQSTAYAIANLGQFGSLRTTAAIGTTRASQLYKRVVLYSDIQSAANNTTRFWVLGTRDALPTKADKTVLLFLGVGRISDFLSALGSHSRRSRIELLRVESRPTKKGLGSYHFLIEVGGHRLDKKIIGLLTALKKKQPYIKIRVVGSFSTKDQGSN